MRTRRRDIAALGGVFDRLAQPCQVGRAQLRAARLHRMSRLRERRRVAHSQSDLCRRDAKRHVLEIDRREITRELLPAKLGQPRERGMLAFTHRAVRRSLDPARRVRPA
jgi:hypothetical protein